MQQRPETGRLGHRVLLSVGEGLTAGVLNGITYHRLLGRSSTDSWQVAVVWTVMWTLLRFGSRTYRARQQKTTTPPAERGDDEP